MREKDPRGRSIVVGLVCTALVALAVVAVRRPPAPPLAERPVPAGEEIDSLSRYLGPVAPAPAVDDYDAYLPAALPPPRPLRREEPAGDTFEPERWRLSAIMISGERPLAIINDRQVRTGEQLDGALVLTIERDRVVLRRRDGSRHTLRLHDALERS